MKDTDIYNLCKKIQPIYRSITGAGNQKTLKIFKKINPKLKILHFNSGKKVFDWKIPKVWSIKDAWIKSIKTNKKIITFKENFLSVMGYSQPINRVISNKELKKKIYSLKSQPNATPYVTSYYKKDWAFCMSENKKKKLKENFYKIGITRKKWKIRFRAIPYKFKLIKFKHDTLYNCYLLEKKLKIQFPHHNVEIINAAVAGYHVFQHTQYILSELIDYEPDLIIFFDGINDHFINNPNYNSYLN